ncbi:MAG: IPT/TIG domain-containing protein [Treponema sp.]|nr:IPT/TIG domain-containing protein [Treponema sp.]
MNVLYTYRENFRRHPWVRTVTWVLLLLVVFGLTTVIGINVKKTPEIFNINPPVGAPGDVMVISGENFGNTRNSSYVEIAGSRLTASGYLYWSDSQIKVLLPSNVQDGLVVVGTSAGRSKPGFFANEAGIPVAVRSDAQTSMPRIASVSPETATIGQTVTIMGVNFGSVRGTSKVFFAANRDDIIVEDHGVKSAFVAAHERDFDYEFWSDTEIRVRVPDGAASGPLLIETEKGTSQATQTALTVHQVGSKKYGRKRTYVIQVNADIANAVSSQDASIILYVPRPVRSAMQPMVDLTECQPEPFSKDDPSVVIHQRPLRDFARTKQRFMQNFVVDVYSVTSLLSATDVERFHDTSRLLYTTATMTDFCVPANNMTITNLRDTILQRERNPYTQAKLFYNYMIAAYKLRNSVRTGNVSVLDLISKKTGDAYDFAILFTALCRSAGIPALPVSGILVENNSTSRSHWWTEIYFEGFGWFPVDVALGAGLQFKRFAPVENPASFYFGNLDGQHVAFSRGWNQLRPVMVNSKVVYRPRTYALQSIWEEASSGASSYSSLWNEPVVSGIY